MSKDIINALQGPYNHAYALLAQFMDTCPENIWEETNGGWPVWQQVAHALAVLNFFILEKEDDQFLPAPCDINTLMLKEQGKSPVTRAAMKQYGATVKAAVDGWLANISDAELTHLQARLSKRIGRDMPYAAVVSMLASHTNYHLGSCDAALRDHGLPGVF